jgi:hypothetical protein
LTATARAPQQKDTDMNDADSRPAVVGQVEPSVRPDPERAAFERWAAQRWGAEAYRHTSATSGEWDAWQAGRESARARFRDALWETYKMIDPIRPPGTPGSYVRGEHNGVAAALQTLKENFNREMP